MYQIYYFTTNGGSWIYGSDGDYGGALNPENAAEFKTVKECRLIIKDCSQRWRMPDSRFNIFKKVSDER